MARYEVRQRKGREWGVYIYDLRDQRTVSFYHTQRRWQAEDDCDRLNGITPPADRKRGPGGPRYKPGSRSAGYKQGDSAEQCLPRPPKPERAGAPSLAQG